MQQLFSTLIDSFPSSLLSSPSLNSTLSLDSFTACFKHKHKHTYFRLTHHEDPPISSIVRCFFEFVSCYLACLPACTTFCRLPTFFSVQLVRGTFPKQIRCQSRPSHALAFSGTPLVIMEFPPTIPRRPSPQPKLMIENHSSSNIEGIGVHSLRTSVRKVQMVYSTWLDQDDSGDYNPGAGRKTRRSKYQPRPVPLEPASLERVFCEPISFKRDPFEPTYQKDCTACTRDRVVCSYREGGDLWQPCYGCEKLNRRCVLPTPRTRRGHGPLPAQESEYSVSKSPASPRRVVERANEEKSQLPEAFILSTRLAHPIEFNFLPVKEDNQIACHWCDSMVYGMLGLGITHATVFDGGDGKGYVEIENGHISKGHIPSRMCIECTTRRLSVMACNFHEMQELTMMEGLVVDQEMQARHLEFGQQDSAPFDWCSICTNVAYYACGKSNVFPDSLLPAKIDSYGCGLRLCTDCMIKLVGRHDGDLTSFLTDLFSEEQRVIDTTLRFRADVHLLHPEGDLMRRVRHNTTQTEATESEPACATIGQFRGFMHLKSAIKASHSGL